MLVVILLGLLITMVLQVAILIELFEPENIKLKKIIPKRKEKAVFFKTKSYKELRADRIVKDNNKQGKDTPLSDIL